MKMKNNGRVLRIFSTFPLLLTRILPALLAIWTVAAFSPSAFAQATITAVFPNPLIAPNTATISPFFKGYFFISGTNFPQSAFITTDGPLELDGAPALITPTLIVQGYQIGCCAPQNGQTFHLWVNTPPNGSLETSDSIQLFSTPSLSVLSSLEPIQISNPAASSDHSYRYFVLTLNPFSLVPAIYSQYYSVTALYTLTISPSQTTATLANLSLFTTPEQQVNALPINIGTSLLGPVVDTLAYSVPVSTILGDIWLLDQTLSGPQNKMNQIEFTSQNASVIQEGPDVFLVIYQMPSGSNGGLTLNVRGSIEYSMTPKASGFTQLPPLPSPGQINYSVALP